MYQEVSRPEIIFVDRENYVFNIAPNKNIHITGKIFVFGYDFCVIQVLVDIKNNRVHGVAIINKIWYFPHYIYGEI